MKSERLLEVDHPVVAHPDLVRVRVVPHVAARSESEDAALDPPDMARPDHLEAVRRAGLEHLLPQRHAVLAGLVEVDLEAELRGVPGARHQHPQAVELVGPHVVVGDVEDAVTEQVRHHVLRLRALHLERADVELLDRHVVVVVVGHATRPQLHVAVREREPEAVLLDAQQDGVVDDPAVGEAEEDVLALLHVALVEVARHEQLGEVKRVRPRDLDLPLDPDVPERHAVQQVPVLLHGVAVMARVVHVVVDAVQLHPMLARRVEIRRLADARVEHDPGVLVDLWQGVTSAL